MHNTNDERGKPYLVGTGERTYVVWASKIHAPAYELEWWSFGHESRVCHVYVQFSSVCSRDDNITRQNFIWRRFLKAKNYPVQKLKQYIYCYEMTRTDKNNIAGMIVAKGLINHFTFLNCCVFLTFYCHFTVLTSSADAISIAAIHFYVFCQRSSCERQPHVCTAPFCCELNSVK